jgi:heme ABC exporter ATP-binding subunit CcmA
MSSSELVACRGLVRRFGEREALVGVDASVADGELVLLVGPNGAGKTTLLRILATALRPTAGHVALAGHELPRAAAAARPLVGYAGHEPLLYDALTAVENLELYAALYGVEAAAVARALDEVGLSGRARERVGELSRGMRQRLALARARLHRPRLLLLDEPTAALDEAGRALLRTVLAPGPRPAAVVATHEPGWFDGLGGRVVRLDGGRVAA